MPTLEETQKAIRSVLQIYSSCLQETTNQALEEIEKNQRSEEEVAKILFICETMIVQQFLDVLKIISSGLFNDANEVVQLLVKNINSLDMPIQLHIVAGEK